MLESLNVLKKLEALIKEHGSASILKDHVNLLREQISISDKKITDLESTINELESKLNDCLNEKQSLNKIINSLQKAQSEKNLTEITEETLNLFFESAENLSRNFVSSILGLEPSVIAYHFDILLEKRFICLAESARGQNWVLKDFPEGQPRPATYKITASGRKYIIEKST